MKQYKVVPYVASITVKQTTQAVAQSVEEIINGYASQGWMFESIEKFETKVNDPGCFGIGAKDSTGYYQLIIFSNLNA